MFRIQHFCLRKEKLQFPDTGIDAGIGLPLLMPELCGRGRKERRCSWRLCIWDCFFAGYYF